MIEVTKTDWQIMQKEGNFTAPWQDVLKFYKKKYENLVVNNFTINMQPGASEAFIEYIENPGCCWKLCHCTQDVLYAPSWLWIKRFYAKRSYGDSRAQFEQVPKLII